MVTDVNRGDILRSMQTSFERAGTGVMIDGVDGDHITKSIYESKNFYEPEMLQFIESLSPRGTVVDVGANIGNHAVFFGLFTPCEQVLAVEPYPLAFDLLRQNIFQNGLGGIVHPIPAALGSRPGHCDIVPGPSSNIGTTLTKAGNTTTMTTLDDIVGNSAVSLVKIDVEGNEVDVLSGGLRLLTNQSPLLFIEAASDRDKYRIDSMLNPLGYRDKAVFNWTPTYFYSR